MAAREPGRREVLTVGEFSQAPELGLDLEVLQGEAGMDNIIRSARIQKLGLALAGFTGYIHSDRVQFLGGSEFNYLRRLDPEGRRAALQCLSGQEVCCIVITKGLEAPPELLALAGAEKIPILRSTALSSTAISKVCDYLERRLAPRTTIHGVFLDVFGLGILLLGPSGIGKSECALDLILKGHRLVTDDYVEITRIGQERLMGSGGKILEHHMEVRGLGIINVKELFGISATGWSQALDLAVRLERWQKDAEYDRLGLEQSTVEFLGLTIPLIRMPVAPGRNVSTLVEVAARLHLLRQRGYHPAQELVKDCGAGETAKNQTHDQP
jgi:HPr kinase/phosphorylase